MSDVTATERRFRAVIVDDEPAGRAAVTTFLADVDAVEVVGEAGDGARAIELIREAEPDLLFLDIQMPDRDGFAVLEALGGEVPRGVVLVTAHGDYAQRAFDVHAVDYVQKPFGRRRFMAAVERALRRLAAEEALDLRSTLESVLRSVRLEGEVASEVAPEPTERSVGPGPARLGVRLGSRTLLVDVDSIDWVEADGDLVRLHVGTKAHLLKSTMRDLEGLLGRGRFVRIHRSVIVNLSRCEVLHREADGGGSLQISSGVRLRVARSRWEALEAALGLRTEGPG